MKSKFYLILAILFAVTVSCSKDDTDAVSEKGKRVIAYGTKPNELFTKLGYDENGQLNYVKYNVGSDNYTMGERSKSTITTNSSPFEILYQSQTNYINSGKAATYSCRYYDFERNEDGYIVSMKEKTESQDAEYSNFYTIDISFSMRYSGRYLSEIKSIETQVDMITEKVESHTWKAAYTWDSKNRLKQMDVYKDGMLDCYYEFKYSKNYSNVSKLFLSEMQSGLSTYFYLGGLLGEVSSSLPSSCMMKDPEGYCMIFNYDYKFAGRYITSVTTDWLEEEDMELPILTLYDFFEYK